MTAADQVRWLSRLADDNTNFRAALTTLRDEQSTELLLRLAAALDRFWFVRGHLREGSRWLEEALRQDKGPTELRANALSAAAQLAYRLGEYARAKQLNEDAMAAWRILGDRAGVGRTLNRFADLAEASGDLDGAEALWLESAGAAREAGDEFGLAVATANLGS